MDICKKCGETPKLTAMCELRAMPGMGTICAVTGKSVEPDKK